MMDDDKDGRRFKVIKLETLPPDILDEDEIPLLETRPIVLGFIIKPLILLFISLITLSIGIGAILLLISIIWLTIELLKWKNTSYVITNKRVIIKTGIIGIDYTDANLSKINNIFFKQGILGRIFNYGSIWIATAGVMGMPFVEFKSIRNPKGTLRLLKKLIS